MWVCLHSFLPLSARQLPYVHPISNLIYGVRKQAGASEISFSPGIGHSTTLFSTYQVNRSIVAHNKSPLAQFLFLSRPRGVLPVSLLVFK